MNPQVLIDPSTTSPLPAPYWFVEVFKILGFVLHAVPMNIWFVGLAVALYMLARGNEPGKRFGARLILQMPVVVAAGINLGIVPLLFLQVAYNKVFYPATILMAWFWIAIIGLLIPAYYGVYLLSFGVRGGSPSPVQRWAGRLAVVFLVLIGLIFAYAMSLTAHVGRWPALWLAHESGGAATGWGLDVGDLTVLPRWLLMVGLATGTTAAWALIDSAWFARGESSEYHAWVRRFAQQLFVAGAAISLVAGAIYAGATCMTLSWRIFFGWKTMGITIVAAASLCGPPALMWLWREKRLSRQELSLLAASQLGVLAVQAISRQLIQNYELRFLGAFDPSAQPTATQWSPLLAFLALFAAGVAVVGWMVLQVIKAETVRQS